jgi:hypothetical protein
MPEPSVIPIPSQKKNGIMHLAKRGRSNPRGRLSLHSLTPKEALKKALGVTVQPEKAKTDKGK